VPVKLRCRRTGGYPTQLLPIPKTTLIVHRILDKFRASAPFVGAMKIDCPRMVQGTFNASGGFRNDVERRIAPPR
jgi:hypothetical protein